MKLVLEIYRKQETLYMYVQCESYILRFCMHLYTLQKVTQHVFDRL